MKQSVGILTSIITVITLIILLRYAPAILIIILALIYFFPHDDPLR